MEGGGITLIKGIGTNGYLMEKIRLDIILQSNTWIISNISKI